MDIDEHLIQIVTTCICHHLQCDIDNPQVDMSKLDDFCSKHNIGGWYDGTILSEMLSSKSAITVFRTKRVELKVWRFLSHN